jgi:hypothetical protein
MLGRARSNAISLQKPHGIMFITDMQGNPGDPAQFRTYVVEVIEGDYPAAGGNRDTYLELTDTEFIPLPPGVGVQTLNETMTGVTDRYLGFNSALSNGNTGTYLYGGVILFNGRGQVVNRTYGFVTSIGGGAAAKSSRMNDLVLKMPLNANGFENPGGSGSAATNPLTAPSTAVGFVLFDRPQFLANGNDRDEHVDKGNADSSGEEAWIDSNGIPLMVNRYNGSLVRGSQ